MLPLLVAILAVAVGAAHSHNGLLFNSPLYYVLQQMPDRLAVGPCRSALQQYLFLLDRGVPWAAKLYDSSVKYPDGLHSSNGYNLGHFDECLAVESGEFTGKYCLAKILRANSNSSSIKSPATRFKISRRLYHIGTCWPSVCSAREIQRALQNLSSELFTTDRLAVTIQEDQCFVLQESSHKDYDFKFWIRQAFLLVLAISVYSTWLGCSDGIGACFSITRHWTKLFDESDVDNSYIACIHGLRAIAIFIVVIGHRAEAIAGAPLHNPEVVEKMFENAVNVLFLNGTVVVDIFFTISGFLLCWKMIQAQKHGIQLSALDILKHRYLRLTPAYLAAILIQGWLLEDAGSGPLWGLRVSREAAFCRNNWWANLLFIQNFYKPGEMCIDPSWYLACDIQLLLLVPLVIKPLLTWRRYRLVPFIVAFTAAIWIPFIVTFNNGLDPTVIPDMTTVVRAAEDKTNQYLYVTTYCRAGPYLVGVAAAVLLHCMQRTNYLPQQRTWTLGKYMAASCMVGSIVVGYPFFTAVSTPPLYTALYAASFRTIFSLGVAFIVIAGTCVNIEGWLCSPALRPLSKVSYSIFLTHTFWIQMSYSWMRSPLHSSDLFQVSIFLSDLIICTIIGIAFHLLLERPAAELTSLVMYPKAKQNISQS